MLAASALAADLFLDGFLRVGLRSPFELADEGRGGPGGTSESPDLALLATVEPAVVGVGAVDAGVSDIVAVYGEWEEKRRWSRSMAVDGEEEMWVKIGNWLPRSAPLEVFRQAGSVLT